MHFYDKKKWVVSLINHAVPGYEPVYTLSCLTPEPFSARRRFCINGRNYYRTVVDYNNNYIDAEPAGAQSSNHEDIAGATL